jgi:hypothetical protein
MCRNNGVMGNMAETVAGFAIFETSLKIIANNLWYTAYG